MLALPAVTAPAGFAPSAAALLGCWLYMVMTGLLVAEVNLSLLCAVGNGSGTGLISMVKRTLGGGGTALAWAGLSRRLELQWATFQTDKL